MEKKALLRAQADSTISPVVEVLLQTANLEQAGKLELRGRGLWHDGEFVETASFESRGRVSIEQYAATIGGLNHALRGPLAWRIGLLISIVGTCVSLGLIPLGFVMDLGDWHIAGWCFLGVFFLAMCLCATAADYLARKRIKQYLQVANDHHYNPRGINLRFEIRMAWGVIIEVLPHPAYEPLDVQGTMPPISVDAPYSQAAYQFAADTV